MSTITYEDWYDKIGYVLHEELVEWLEDAPSQFASEQVDIVDVLTSEYESFIGDLEDRAYDEWKDARALGEA